MNKRNLINLGLLAFVALLVLLVILEPGIEEPEKPVQLLNIDKSAITKFSIKRDAQEDIELVKRADDSWWMEKPVQHAAEPFRIDSLLRIASTKSLSRFAAEEDKLSGFELDSPRVTLTLNDDIKIKFGGSTPLDQRRYVMVDKQIHLISDTLYYHLIGSFPTFLRKQLLAEGVTIESIKLPALSITWQENRWQLTPQPENFSADQVTALVDNWKLASALEIKAYDGQSGEMILIKLQDNETPIEFLVTSKSPDFVLASPAEGIQYHLDTSSSEMLLQLPELNRSSSKEETIDNHNH